MAYKISDEEAKAKLVRLSGYARTATGQVQAPGFEGNVNYGNKFMPQGNSWQSQNLFQKIGSIASQTVHTGFNIGKAITNFGIESGKTTYQDFHSFLKPVAQTLTGSIGREGQLIGEQSRALDKQMAEFTDLYKSGKVSKDWYAQRLRDLSNQQQELSNGSKGIATQADRGNVVEGAVKTFADIMAFGKFTPSSSVMELSKAPDATKLYHGLGFSANLLKEGSLTGEAISRIESIASKVPSVKDILVANGAKFGATSSVFKQSIKDATTALLLKQPLVYHSTIEDMHTTIEDLASGKYGDALAKTFWTAQLALSGGIFGEAAKAFGKGKDLLALKTLGKSSYWDEIAKRTLGGNPKLWVDWLNKLKQSDPEKFKRVEKVMRQAQEHNLRVWKTGEKAADQVAAHYASNHGVELGNISFSKFMDRELKYWDNLEKVNEAARVGKLKSFNGEKLKEGSVAIGLFDQSAREELIVNLKKLSYEDRLKYLQAARADGATFWAQHDTMYTKLYNIVQSLDDKNKMEAAIKEIDAASGLKGLPKKLQKELAKDGYIAIVPKNNLTKVIPVEDTRKLITGAIKKGDEVFDPTVARIPLLNSLYSGLVKYGLSPEANNRIAYQKLSTTVAQGLDELGIHSPTISKAVKSAEDKDATVAGKIILDKLKKYADELPGFHGIGNTSAVSDIRQLTIKDISHALDVSPQEAKAISKSIAASYMKVPLEFRGLGDRAVDAAYQFIPGFKGYSRVQSALRYTYNPFFRATEEVETRMLSKIEGHTLMWKKTKKELDDVIGKLEDARIFSTGFSGEGAANDIILGRLSANITLGQKRNLAGLAAKIAESKGMTVDDLLKNHIDEVEDALRVVVQYPSHGVLASPLARTLNLAFFPMRYNLKVAGIVAKELSKQPPSVQYAFINGVFDMRHWLKSDEGIQWQSQNADAIALFKWLTPYNSIDYVLNLFGHKPESIMDLGLLGGLPFGWIPQMLDSQGVIHTNTPYIDPKTGKLIPKKIPITVKARMATALTDLLNSTFTYPGRILGLPGKNASIKNAVDKFISTDGRDFQNQVQTDRLTPMQKKTMQVLGGDTSDEALKNLYINDQGQWQIPTWDMPFKEFSPVKRQLTALEAPKSKSKGKKTKKTALPLQPIR